MLVVNDHRLITEFSSNVILIFPKLAQDCFRELSHYIGLIGIKVQFDSSLFGLLATKKGHRLVPLLNRTLLKLFYNNLLEAACSISIKFHDV
jgi:hypothetical protein